MYNYFAKRVEIAFNQYLKRGYDMSQFHYRGYRNV